jgi:hypothetical protein
MWIVAARAFVAVASVVVSAASNAPACRRRGRRNIVAWWQDDRRFVGYWFGQRFWGRVGTAALRQFLQVTEGTNKVKGRRFESCQPTAGAF